MNNLILTKQRSRKPSLASQQNSIKSYFIHPKQDKPLFKIMLTTILSHYQFSLIMVKFPHSSRSWTLGYLTSPSCIFQLVKIILHVGNSLLAKTWNHTLDTIIFLDWCSLLANFHFSLNSVTRLICNCFTNYHYCFNILPLIVCIYLSSCFLSILEQNYCFICL